jgi:hypothetical protein
MKTYSIRPIHLAALTVLSALSLHPSALFGQGSLTPPGAPAPTMKTLAQIEPRTPISAAPFTISAPGSYYLTTNLTVATGNAVIIATNGVTLDLGGFTIASTAPSATGTGVLLTNSLSDISICNGHIKGGVTNNAGTYNGPGFSFGIAFSSVAPVNTRVAGVSVSGCLFNGIFLSTGDSTVVESCTVRTVGNQGIYASTIKSSVAVDCGSHAVSGDQVSDSRGESTGGGSGVAAATALNCYGSSASGSGLLASTALNCYGNSSSGYGLFIYCTAQNCYGISTSGGAGLYAVNASFCSGNRSGGTAIQATVATGCFAIAGTNSITHKYNMP